LAISEAVRAVPPPEQRVTKKEFFDTPELSIQRLAQLLGSVSGRDEAVATAHGSQINGL
jgi:hypothetical protein